MPIVLPSGDDRSRQIPTNASQVRGSSNLSHYADLYKQIVQRNGGQAPYAMPNPQQNFRQQQQQEEPAWKQQHGYREMNDFERTISGIGRLGETIAGASGGFQGFNENESPVESLAKFAFTLPTGMASAPFTGTAHLMEGITGTPFTETEGDYIADYELDAGQRLGAAGTGLVDTAGLLLGGSAQALNAGRNVLRAGLGKNAVGPVGLTASRFMGRGPAAVAVDTAEEGLEEGLQSFAEDLRYDQLNEDSLGRAAEAAGWGALGGAMMSGGGQMLNSALHNGDSATARTNAPQHDQDSLTEFSRHADNYIEGGRTSNSVAKYERDQMNASRKIPGSGINLLIGGNKDLGYADSELGSEFYRGAFYSKDVRAKEALAEGLNTDVRTMEDAVSKGTEVERREALNKIVADAWAKYRSGEGHIPYAVFNRTPSSALNQDAAVKVNVVGILPGTGMAVHPQMEKLIGSDRDGDTVMTYVGFSSGENIISARYAFRQMFDEATGNSLFDKDYMAFMHEYGEEKFYDDDNNMFDIADGSVDSQGRLFRERADKQLKAIRKEIVAGNVNGFTKELGTLQSILWEYNYSTNPEYATADESTKSRIRAAAGDKADNQLSDLILGMEANSRNACKSIIDSSISELSKEAADAKVNLNLAKSKGYIGSTNPNEVATQFGDMFTAYLYGGHPVFRQNAEKYYPTHWISSVTDYNGEWEVLQEPSIFQIFIAQCYRLDTVGGEVETAIDGYFKQMVADELLRSASISNINPYDNEAFDKMIGNFVRAYNRAAEKFNKAIDSAYENKEFISTNPGILDKLKEYRKNFNKTDLKAEDTAGIAREMLSILGGRNLGETFALSGMDSQLENMSLETLVQNMAGSVDKTWFTDSHFRKYLIAMVASNTTKSKRTGATIHNQFKSIHGDLYKVYSDNKIPIKTEQVSSLDFLTANQKDVLLQICDIIHEMISPRAALALGIDTDINLYNSPWGKQLLSQDEEKFFGALRSILFTAKLQDHLPVSDNPVYDDEGKPAARRNLFGALYAYEHGGDEDLLYAEIEYALSKAKNDSFLFRAIWELWLDDKEAAIYMIKDISSMKTKDADVLSEIKIITDDKDAGYDVLWAELLSSADNRLELTAVTKRLALAKAKSVALVTESEAYARGQLESIIKACDERQHGLTKAKAYEFFKNSLELGSVQVHEDVLASALWSSKGFAKPDTEKGQSRESASFVQQSLADAAVGQVFSTISSAGRSLDLMSLGDVLVNREELTKLLMNPNAEISAWTVVENADGSSLQIGSPISYQKIYNKLLGIDLKKGEEVSPDQFFELLKKFPSLVTYFTPQRVAPIYSETSISVQTGMATTPISYILDSAKKDDLQLKREILANRIRHELMMSPEAMSWITLSFESVSDKTLPEIKKELSNLLDRYVNAIIYALAIPDSNEFDSWLDKTFSTGTVGELSTIVKTLFKDADVYAFSADVQSILEKLQSDADESLVDAFFTPALKKAAKKHGIKLEDSDSSDIDFDLPNMSRLYESKFRIGLIAFEMSRNNFDVWLENFSDELVRKTDYISGRLPDPPIEPDDNAPQSEKDAYENKLKEYNDRVAAFYSEIGFDPNEGKFVDLDWFKKNIADGLITDAAKDVDKKILSWDVVQELAENNSVDELVRRCTEISERSADDGSGLDISGKLAKKNVEAIEDAVKEYQKGNTAPLIAIHRAFNQIVFDMELKSVLGGTGKRVVESAPIMFLRAKDDQKDFVRSLRKQMEDEGRDYTKTFQSIDGNFSFPELHPEKPDVAAASTVIKEIMLSAPIEAGIAMDAANLNYVGFMGIIDPGTECSASFEEITIGELYRILSNPDGITDAVKDRLDAVIPGWDARIENGDSRAVATWRIYDEANNRYYSVDFNWLADRIADGEWGTTIKIARPIKCRCGSCKKHSNQPNYLGVTLSALVSESMEAGWLKRKKTFGALSELVRNPERHPELAFSKRVFDFTSKEDIENKLVNIRCKVAAAFAEEYGKVMLPSLDFDMSNWETLASAVTPFVKMSVTNADGQTEFIVVSVSKINDLDTIIPAGVQINNFEIGLCNFDEVSNKIGLGVKQALQKGLDLENSKVLRAVVDEAYTDWSGYAREIDIEDMFSRITPRKGSIPSAAYGDLSWTAAQAFKESLRFAGKKAKEKSATRRPWDKAVEEKISNQQTNVRDICNGFPSDGGGGNVTGFALCSITVHGEINYPNKRRNRKFEDLASALPSLSEAGFGNVHVGYRQEPKWNLDLIDGSDTSKIASSIKQAISYGHNIAVPTSLLDSLKAELPPFYTTMIDSANKGAFSVSGREYSILLGAMVPDADFYSGTDYGIDAQDVNSDNFAMMILDEFLMNLADAGSKLHPDYLQRYNRIHEGVSSIPVSDMFEGRFRDANSLVEVASIDDIKDAFIDNGAIDEDAIKDFVGDNLKFYTNSGQSKEFYVNSIKRYLEKVISGDITSGNTRKNAERGDCIGFIRRGQSFMPIFWQVSGGTFSADASFEITSTGYLRIAGIGEFNTASGNLKIAPYGIAFKSIISLATEEDKDRWYQLADHTGRYGDGKPPEMVIDLNSAKGRIYDKAGKVTRGNLYDYTVATGANIFFDIIRDSADDSNLYQNVKRKDALSKTLTDEDLNKLISGELKAWDRVRTGALTVFDEKKAPGVNAIFRNMVRAVWNNRGNMGGDAFLNVFCTRQIGLVGGVAVDNGNRGRWGHYSELILSKFNMDDVLKIYHMMDEKLCPNGTIDDGDDYFFDKFGRVKCSFKDPSGNVISKRVPCLFRRPVEMHIGSEFMSLSSAASFAGQAAIQKMMRAVSTKETRSTLDYLMVRVGLGKKGISIGYQTKDKSYLESRIDKKNDNLNLKKEVRKNTAGRRWLSRDIAYRYKVEEEIERFAVPVNIYMSDMKEPAHKNEEGKNRIQRGVERLNAALNCDVGLSERYVRILCRFAYAYSDLGSSTDFKGLTINQYETCIDMMVKSIEESGLPIPSKVIYGTSGKARSERVTIPLLPATLASQLFSTSKTINGKFDGNFDKFVDGMYEQLKESVKKMNRIDNMAKKKALWRLADAAALTHGKLMLSGHLDGAVHMWETVQQISRWGAAGGSKWCGDDVIQRYVDGVDKSIQRIERQKQNAWSRDHDEVEYEKSYGGTLVTKFPSDQTVVAAGLRNLAEARRVIGLTYLELLPANILERFINQGTMNLAVKLGQMGWGPYTTTKQIDGALKKHVMKDAGVVKLWSAMREAQLINAEDELLTNIRNSQDIDAAIEKTFKDRGRIAKITATFMNVMSGKDVFISQQIGLFIERFAMQIDEKAPWWNIPQSIVDDEGNTKTVSSFEASLMSPNPAAFFIEIFNGDGTHASPDASLAANCMNWALRGDMAQRNLISAIYAELAKRSAGVDFFVTCFMTPYFNYAMNRAGRLLQWVMPVSSIHHAAVRFFSEGGGKDWKIPGTDIHLGDLDLEDVQLTRDMREACMIDMIHLGPALVAMLLIGAGAMQPPEDEDKWGNFKEWTIFGTRVDANWWLEDTLGLALPLAAFGASIREGKPRVDLVVNGLMYYLNNNPVVKVSDAVGILFDPLGEFQKDYEADLEGYAKAMGGPPSPTEVLMGKGTSFGLSFFAQFVTPGVYRELYNAGIDYERDYKKVYQTGVYGEMTEEGEQGEKVQFTSYQDAIVRKFTRNNPVMGMMADLMFHPETGYMADEMPRQVIYDPYQMNSITHFSLYNDPYTKTEPKTDEEKTAIAIEVIGTLQSKSVEELASEGFVLDYETKAYVSAYIWDIIASLNAEHDAFEESEYANFYYWGDYETGRETVTAIRNDYKKITQEWKDLYYDKLWSKEFTVARYNRRHTTWSQDANGEVYATGYYPTAGWPVTLAPGESPGAYKENMGAEYDWQTESTVTGMPTGMRALVPFDDSAVDVPAITSWSKDGTDTGLSGINNGASTGELSPVLSDILTDAKTPSSNGGRSYGRSGGGGGGYRRGGGHGGGGGGGGYAPSIYSRVNAPNISNADTMRSSRNYEPRYDSLRPSFETKGSRESYRREDI